MKLKVNPYNVFDVRRVDFPPDDFEYTNISITYNLSEALQRWIENNLKSRYYYGKTVVLNDSNKIDSNIKIGFEDPKELSYFMLACPYLKY